MKGTDFVFTGPTLQPAQVRALLPTAQILPPVRHGDLLRLAPGAGDRVFIIDGLFLQAASVRHREILYLLQHGVTVAGSSSMGALRAAELWQFGMRGFGEIFRLYRDGIIDGDAEVAIVHGTAEDSYRGYSDPLVSIRIALREAASTGAISEQDARQLLEVAGAMPFRSRSFRALDAIACAHLPVVCADAFTQWRSAHDTDAKAADARLMLAAAAAGDPELRPAGIGDQPIRHVHTRLLDMWEHRFHGAEADGEWVADADAATALRLAHPSFREAHRQHTLARVTGFPPDHPALIEHAAAAARARGLLPPDSDQAVSWLTERDLAQPADEVLATLLVRAFGVLSGQPGYTKWALPPQMRTPARLAWGREFVTAARRCNERMLTPVPGSTRRQFRPEVVDRAVARLWGCGISELEAQAWDRGIADVAELRRMAEPFVAHLKTSGAPGATTAENLPPATRPATAKEPAWPTRPRPATSSRLSMPRQHRQPYSPRGGDS